MGCVRVEKNEAFLSVLHCESPLSRIRKPFIKERIDCLETVEDKCVLI